MCRQIAGNVMQDLGLRIAAQLQEDFTALTPEFVYRLLLLSLTDLQVHPM